MELPDAIVDRVLESWPVARLAVLDAEGRPRVMPIVFARVSGTLWSPIDGKPKAGGEPARVRYVREHPSVELALDEYSGDWDALWWVRADGLARVVQPSDPANDPEVAPVVEALRQKYPQYQHTPLLPEPPTLLAIRLDRVRSWCAGADALQALASADALRR